MSGKKIQKYENEAKELAVRFAEHDPYVFDGDTSMMTDISPFYLTRRSSKKIQVELKEISNFKAADKARDLYLIIEVLEKKYDEEETIPLEHEYYYSVDSLKLGAQYSANIILKNDIDCADMDSDLERIVFEEYLDI